MKKSIIKFVLLVVAFFAIGIISYFYYGEESLETLNRVLNENQNNEISTNVQENDVQITNNVENENSNIEYPNVIVNPEQTTDEEGAIEIVKQEWGEDDTVAFVNQGLNDNGEYIIVVMDRNTTRTITRYYINTTNGELREEE